MIAWQLCLLLTTLITHEIQSMYYPSFNDQYPNSFDVKLINQRHAFDIPSPCRNKNRKEQKKGLWWILPIPQVDFEYDLEKTPGILGNVPPDKNDHKEASAQHAPQQKCALAANATTEKSNAPAQMDCKCKVNTFAKTGHSGQQKQAVVGNKAQLHGASNVAGGGKSKGQLSKPAIHNKAHFNAGHQQPKKALTGNEVLKPQNNGVSSDFNNANYYAHFQDEPGCRGLLTDNLIADSPCDKSNSQYNNELPRIYGMPQYYNEIQKNVLSKVPVVGTDQQKNIQYDQNIAPSQVDENWNSQDFQRFKQNLKSGNLVIS